MFNKVDLAPRRVVLILASGGIVILLWLGLVAGLSIAPIQHAQALANIHYVDDDNCPGPGTGTIDDPFCRIQDGVEAATDEDEILIATGTYTDIHQRDGITQVVYLTKGVTILGGYNGDFAAWDPDLYPTTLDAGSLGRVLVITGSITPTVVGLHVTGGDASGLGGLSGDPASFDAGGGVYAYGATPTISRCTFYSNTASTTDRGFGGGLYLEGATLLVGNTMRENTASTANFGSGGGMYLNYGDGSVLDGNTVLSNTASVVGGGSGGGVRLHQSDTALMGNTFRGNVASTATSDWGYGGGLYVYNSDISLTENSLRGNTASTLYSAYGGGAYLRGGDFTVEGNWIVGNIASQNPGYTGLGGGVYVYQARVITLVNNVIADNYAYHFGSGISIDSEPSDPTIARLLHNTIADNEGGTGGVRLDTHVTAFVTNTILAGHTNAALRVEGTSTATLEATLWHGNGSLTFGDGLVISSTNFYSPPGFVDPSAWDYHLAAESAAIDRVVGGSGIATDIDGQARPAGDGYDLGADEYWNRVYLSLVIRNQ